MTISQYTVLCLVFYGALAWYGPAAFIADFMALTTDWLGRPLADPVETKMLLIICAGLPGALMIVGWLGRLFGWLKKDSVFLDVD